MKKLLFYLLAFGFLLQTTSHAQISLEVDTVYQGQELGIEVTAENVDFTQGSNLIHFINGSKIIYMNNIDVNSPTSITINTTFSTTDPIGFYDLTIDNSQFGISLEQKKAIYVAPSPIAGSVDHISVSSASQGDAFSTTIYGENIGYNLNQNSTVYFRNGSNTIYSSGISLISLDSIVVNFDISYVESPGFYSIYVNNPSLGLLFKDYVFELYEGPNQPSIIGISEDTVMQGEVLTVEITSNNFDFTQGTNLIHFKQGNVQVPVSNFVFTGTNKLTLNTFFNAQNPTGYYYLSIVNSSGFTITKASALFVQGLDVIPSLDSISVKSATRPETISMKIYHSNSNINTPESTNFMYLTKDISGSPNSIYPTSIVYEEEFIEAVFEFNVLESLGSYSVIIYNSLDGQLTLPSAFTLNGPILTPFIRSISIDTIMQGETLEIEVTAENVDFTQGSNIIHFTHQSVGNKLTISGNQVVIVNSNTLRFNALFNASLPTGDYKLDVGFYSATENMTLNNAIFVKPIDLEPKIDSISPNLGTQGEIVYVTVYGTNTHFNQTTVNYLERDSHRIYAHSFSKINDTAISLEFRIFYDDSPGIYTLSIGNPIDGTVTLANCFEVLLGDNAPRIVSVNVDTVYTNETLTIQVSSANMDFSSGTTEVRLARAGRFYYPTSMEIIDENTISFVETFDDQFEEGAYDIEITNSITTETVVKKNAIYYKGSVGVGIFDKENVAHSFFPNPANEVIFFSENYTTIKVMDLNGLVLIDESNVKSIDVSKLNKGTFLLQIISEKGISTNKIQIQ